MHSQDRRRVPEAHSHDSAAQKDWSRHFIRLGLEAFEQLMANHGERGITGRYAYGDAVTAADIFLVPQVYNAVRLGMDLTPFPRLSAAAAAAAATPAARAAAPERQPDAPLPTTP